METLLSVREGNSAHTVGVGVTTHRGRLPILKFGRALENNHQIV
ncbi:hypothetical protein ACFXG4_31400 [Nocardia sp. NPDC059246]